MAKLPRLPSDANDRAVHDPLSYYKLSDADDAADPQYYGKLTVDGAWHILKISSGGAVHRYAAGLKNYTTAWANRASLGYDYFDIIF